MAKKRGLGRGLNALIKEIPVTDDRPAATPAPASAPAAAPAPAAAATPVPAPPAATAPAASPAPAAAPAPASKDSMSSVAKMPIDRIARSSVQPRHVFEKEPMEDLVRSVKEHGILQPLLVRSRGNDFELIAGERRLRAATEAGLKEVPVIKVEADDETALEIALIENLQRENLNVIEEAEGYRSLADDFEMTQEQIAKRVGKARASVANTMRLLELPDEVKGYLSEGKIAPGHAKALLGLEIAEEQILLSRRIINERLSVRQTEKVVVKVKSPAKKPRAKREDIPTANLTQIADELRRHLGTSVKVTSCSTLANGKKSKGRMEIEFYSLEDFNRILDLLGVPADGHS